MTKSTITKIWIVGMIVLAAGLILGGASTGLLLAFGGHFTPASGWEGATFIPRMDGFFWTSVSLMTVGFFVAAIGAVAALVAWIGALVNTYQQPDKTWFALLLSGGLISLVFPLVGFAVMIAYVAARTDDMAAQQRQAPMAASAQQSTALMPIE